MSILNYTLAYTGKDRKKANEINAKLKRAGFITKRKGNDVWRKFNEQGF